MINDPVVQKQMERMRTAQSEADAAANMAARSGGGQSGAEGFASGFNRFFDPSKFKMPGATPASPAQGIQAKAGDGMTLASTTGAPGASAGSGGLGMSAPSTPFGQGIGAGIQAGLSGGDAQTAVNYGLGGQPAKKLW